MEVKDWEKMVSEHEDVNLSLAFPALMRKVYLWMTLALGISGLTAYLVATSPGILQLIYGNSLTIWVLLIAELVLVFKISGSVWKERRSLAATTLMFALFSVLNGATLSSIFVAYAPAAIIKTFMVTTGTFAAMALYGYTTRRDLTKLGGLSTMAIIGLIIASVVNMFLHSSTLDLVVSGIGVLTFVGLTAWDSQRIKMQLAMAPDMGEGSQKIALVGALSLYLDFVNLFLYLLRFFGGNRE